MSCQYGCDDCINTNKCYLCINANKYIAPKKKTSGLSSKNYNKQSKRMGSVSETKVQQQNQNTIDNVCSSRLTKNSGAGFIGAEKADAWITGLVEIAQEIKTQLPDRAKGCKSFSVQKDWLDKLTYESQKANKEFWYLLFSFKETDDQFYVVCDNQVFQDMVATLVADRKVAKEAQKQIDIANKAQILSDKKNSELLATIDRMQAEIDYLKAQLKE